MKLVCQFVSKKWCGAGLAEQGMQPIFSPLDGGDGPEELDAGQGCDGAQGAAPHAAAAEGCQPGEARVHA